MAYTYGMSIYTNVCNRSEAIHARKLAMLLRSIARRFAPTNGPLYLYVCVCVCIYGMYIYIYICIYINICMVYLYNMSIYMHIYAIVFI